jgi:hypothetical protein
MPRSLRTCLTRRGHPSCATRCRPPGAGQDRGEPSQHRHGHRPRTIASACSARRSESQASRRRLVIEDRLPPRSSAGAARRSHDGRRALRKMLTSRPSKPASAVAVVPISAAAGSAAAGDAPCVSDGPSRASRALITDRDTANRPAIPVWVIPWRSPTARFHLLAFGPPRRPAAAADQPGRPGQPRRRTSPAGPASRGGGPARPARLPAYPSGSKLGLCPIGSSKGQFSRSRADLAFSGRDGGIRTHDLFVPNEARYQAAPHPDHPKSTRHGPRPGRPGRGRLSAGLPPAGSPVAPVHRGWSPAPRTRAARRRPRRPGRGPAGDPARSW